MVQPYGVDKERFLPGYVSLWQNVIGSLRILLCRLFGVARCGAESSRGAAELLLRLPEVHCGIIQVLLRLPEVDC